MGEQLPAGMKSLKNTPRAGVGQAPFMVIGGKRNLCKL